MSSKVLAREDAFAGYLPSTSGIRTPKGHMGERSIVRAVHDWDMSSNREIKVDQGVVEGFAPKETNPWV